MSKVKSSFTSYLEEFSGGYGIGGMANAFSANVLGNSQLTQDTEQGDNEKDSNKKKEAKLRKEIEDSLADSTNNDDSLVDTEDKEPKNSRILKHLKNLLFKMPGAENVDFEQDGSAEPDDGTDAEGNVYNDGRQLMSNGEPVKQSPYGKFDDPTNSRKMPDATYTAQGNGPEDDKHEQLINAIKELRNELRKSRGGGAVEQEEDVAEEDEAGDDTQFANAGKMFQTLVNQKMNRAKIIASFEKNLGVTNSTAVSYYQRLAKNAGLTNSGERTMDQQPQGLGAPAGFEDPNAIAPADAQGAQLPQETNISGIEVPNDPNRQGLIRTVKGAHLVYKRKNEEGTFDELWVFNTGGDMENSLKVRRDILAGTDIPPRATKSQNGAQTYTLKTLGNGQILHIKGLPN